MDKPKEWPPHLPFSCSSHSHELPMDLLRLLMFAASDAEGSPLFDKKCVHEALEVRKLTHFVPMHPLADKKTMRGEEQHGVFATKCIEKGEVLGEYVGRIYYFAPGEIQKTAFSEYKWTISHPYYTLVVDSQYGANQLALINDYRGIAESPNVEPSLTHHKGYHYFSYITKRCVFPKEELLIDYGADFSVTTVS